MGICLFFERATSAPERRDPFVATVPRSLMGPLVVVIASSAAEREELNCREELQSDPQLLVDLRQDSSSRSVDPDSWDSHDNDWQPISENVRQQLLYHCGLVLLIALG